MLSFLHVIFSVLFLLSYTNYWRFNYPQNEEIFNFSFANLHKIIEKTKKERDFSLQKAIITNIMLIFANEMATSFMRASASPLI